MRLVLIRHGAAEHTPERRYAGRGTDSALIEKGVEEAEAAAKALAGLRPETVWSGTLIRQKKTADIIAAAADAPRRVDAALDEVDYGAWEGMRKDEIIERWPEAFRAWDERSEWAEEYFEGSAERVLSEFDAWLGRIRKGDGPVVAVTSNGLLRLLGRRYAKRSHGPYGVWTGHCCELSVGEGGCEAFSWNVPPLSIASYRDGDAPSSSPPGAPLP